MRFHRRGGLLRAVVPAAELRAEAAVGLRDFRIGSAFQQAQTAEKLNRSGQQFAQAFSVCTVEWVTHGSALVLHLADPVAQITLRLALALGNGHAVIDIGNGDQMILVGISSTALLGSNWLH